MAWDGMVCDGMAWPTWDALAAEDSGGKEDALGAAAVTQLGVLDQVGRHTLHSDLFGHAEGNLEGHQREHHAEKRCRAIGREARWAAQLDDDGQGAKGDREEAREHRACRGAV
jgi:hypothetical protein